MAEKVAERIVGEMPWLDPVADSVQSAIGNAVKAGGPPAIAVTDFLHGRWLGHPLHPALVAVPLGAWTTTLLLDLAGMEDAADLTLGLGIAGATGSALAGAADWYDTSGPDRRIGLLHALLNAGGLALNVASLAMRRKGARTTGVALSSFTFAMVLVSSFLGGELSYVRGIGVDHTAWDEPPTDFTPALDADELVEGKPVRGQAGSIGVVLVKRGNDILALDATCTHAGGPLHEGTVDGDTIQCPWHGSVFCLRDGSVLHAPATVPAKRFEARIRDGKVEVRLAD